MKNSFLLTFSLLTLSQYALAQMEARLAVDFSSPPVMMSSLFCDKDYNCGLNANESSRAGVIDPAGVPVKVTRAGKNFIVRIDTNRDGRLSDEKARFLRSGSSLRVLIKTGTGPGGSVYLPFEMKHAFATDRGKVVDEFSIGAHYSAVGTLRSGRCIAKVGLIDFNHDGEFDAADAKRGSNLKIDRNNDGKFWGKEEFRKSNEIIEFCGRNFLVSSIKGLRIALTPTDIKLAKVGSAAPSFSFALMDGSAVESDGLRGKHFVLDFWASWCVPCVENLPLINLIKDRYKNRLLIYSVNVDTPDRRISAEEIARKNGLTAFTTIRAMGEDDPFWKSFGSAESNRLAIPLYVLVDGEGVVRYSGNGGEKLKDLELSIEKVISAIPVPRTVGSGHSQFSIVNFNLFSSKIIEN